MICLLSLLSLTVIIIVTTLIGLGTHINTGTQELAEMNGNCIFNLEEFLLGAIILLEWEGVVYFSGCHPRCCLSSRSALLTVPKYLLPIRASRTLSNG